MSCSIIIRSTARRLSGLKNGFKASKRFFLSFPLSLWCGLGGGCGSLQSSLFGGKRGACPKIELKAANASGFFKSPERIPDNSGISCCVIMRFFPFCMRQEVLWPLRRNGCLPLKVRAATSAYPCYPAGPREEKHRFLRLSGARSSKALYPIWKAIPLT